MVDRPRRASGGQLVYTELRRQILDLELKPGQRLFEPELATRMQVSRTPLREALRLLLAEDLLDQLPTGGMVVRPLSAREIEELYSVRAALEGLMTAEAATRLDDAGVATLRALVERNAALVDLPTDAMSPMARWKSWPAFIASVGRSTRAALRSTRPCRVATPASSSLVAASAVIRPSSAARTE